jgi:hypothetical protein
MINDNFRTATVLSVIVGLLAAAASIGGLLIGGLYRDNEFVRTTWFANDLMTLVLAVPLLAGALIMARRGSLRSLLVWQAMLVYMLYNYAFYLFGAAFNAFFLIYVALFSLSIFAMVFSLPRMDAYEIAQLFQDRTPVRWISGFMLFFALLLGGMWIAISLSFVASREVPEVITKFGHPTSIVFALDLSLLMPGMVLGAVLLWQKKAWGYVVASIMNIKATTYALVLIVATVYSLVTRGVGDDFLPLYLLLGIGNLAASLFLLGNMHPAHQREKTFSGFAQDAP